MQTQMPDTLSPQVRTKADGQKPQKQKRIPEKVKSHVLTDPRSAPAPEWVPINGVIASSPSIAYQRKHPQFSLIRVGRL